jgi:uncharacterized protein YjbI with pentapeptide repeats
MATDRPVLWAPCINDGCDGVQLASAAVCLAHVADQDGAAFESELKRIGDEGTIDARGVQLSAELLKRILDAAPHKEDRLTLEVAQFDRAILQGGAGFDGAIFRGEAFFAGATFTGEAWFSGVTFQGEAGFDGATFQGKAGFDGATFQGKAGFDGATFQRARQVGPLVAEQLIIDRAVFSACVNIEATAAVLRATGAQFPAGMQIRLRWATVVLDDADLSTSTSLAVRSLPFPGLNEPDAAHRWERLLSRRAKRPGGRACYRSAAPMSPACG